MNGSTLTLGLVGALVLAGAVRRRVQEGSAARTVQRTDPALWEAVKAEVTASDKGGRPGQWSARKAQRSVQLYKERGGSYLGPKDPDNALARWTDQDWRTRSGGESLETGERYLPDAAFDRLTPAEVGATTRAKRAGLARGQQFTPQPPNIARKTRTAREGGVFARRGGSNFIRKGSAMIDPYMLRRRRGSAKSATAVCPPATQDIALNTENRDRAIRMFDYGPPNPAQPSSWFWKKIASRWSQNPSAEQIEETKTMRCGNCGVFDVSPGMRACMPRTYAPDAYEAAAMTSGAVLGYCWAHNFKCASTRTCATWVQGPAIASNARSPMNKV